MSILKEITVVKTYKRTIETEKIENTPYSYYKDTLIIICDGKRSATVKKGATLDEYISETTGLNTIKTVVPAPQMYNGCATIKVIKKDDLKHIQVGEVHISDVMYSAKHNYGQIKDNEMLVLWNSGSNKLCDLNGNFIPLPIKIGYIEGCLANDQYDLHKVLELVKNNKHVLNRENVEITPIPYYNCYDDHTHSIEFKYLADVDEYQILMELYLKDSYEMYRYIINKSIGAEQFNKEDDN